MARGTLEGTEAKISAHNWGCPPPRRTQVKDKIGSSIVEPHLGVNRCHPGGSRSDNGRLRCGLRERSWRAVRSRGGQRLAAFEEDKEVGSTGSAPGRSSGEGCVGRLPGRLKGVDKRHEDVV